MKENKILNSGYDRVSGVENKKGPHAIKVHDFKLTACNICTLTNERFSRVYSIVFFFFIGY